VTALRHVLWIGGPPGAGKTTVALRIARRHGLRWYGADMRTWQHRDRALRAGNAAAWRWESMTSEQRWVEATPAQMLAMSLHHERGAMVIDDLRALPESPLVIAEGTTLPASVVSQAIADPSRAVWLLPTPSFQRVVLDGRNLAAGPRALYKLLGATIRREAQANGVRTLTVDGTGGVEQTSAAVEELFADALVEGPRALSTAQRRALLREANTAVVAQVRGYHARPWAQGDADTVVKEFVCECGDVSCVTSVRAPVGAASAAPVLAPGHG
jgi:hypothetical protein